MTCGLCGTEAGARRLCENDTVRLAKRLDDLPTLYDEVAECLVPRRSGWGDIIPTRGSAGPRSPLDEDVIDTVNLARATETVHRWRVAVQRERWPRHGAPPQAGLSSDCRWLAMELDWIATHYSEAGQLASEVWTLESQARMVVGDPEPKRKVIGQCIAVTDDQGTVCGTDITHRMGEDRLKCQACHTVYATQQELLLLLHYQPVAA